MVIHLSYILVNILYCILLTNGQIIIKDSGIGRIEPTDIGMIFYLTLENICPSEMFISVRGVKCCETNSLTGKNDCESMKLMGGDPGMLYAGKTKNVTLIYPNLYLYGRHGVCTVLIVYKVGMVTDHFSHKISFDTKRSFQGTSSKICPCYTSDLDPFRNCSPVDCPMKYSGNKNFFNAMTKYCEPVPHCKSARQTEEMYDILHNRCVDIKCTIKSSDLASMEMRRGVSCPVPNIFGNMICHHGCIDKKTGECLCHEKWISNINNNEPEFIPSLISSHMCNIRVGSWTELNKDKLLLTILVMVIMTSLCVLKLFFIICILHFCYKWARSRSRDDDKGYKSLKSEGCSCICDLGSRKKKSQRDINCCCYMEEDFRSPQNVVACRSQATLARGNNYSDKCFQMQSSNVVNVVTTNVQCDKKEVRSSSAQTENVNVFSDSRESLLSHGETSSTCSTCSTCSLQEDNNLMYPKKDNMTYFASTYTSEFYSSNLPRSSTLVGVEEGTSQTDYSIDMDCETEELELECSSSSDV